MQSIIGSGAVCLAQFPRHYSIQLPKNIVERLGQCRVSENGVTQRGVRQLAEHRQLNHAHHFAAFNPQNRAAENVFGCGVNQNLHHAPRFRHFQRPRNVSHRHVSDAHAATLFLRVAFAQPNAAKLRVNVHGVGHEPPSGGRVAVFDQICSHNPKIIIRNVGKGWAAVDVAKRVHTSDIGLQAFVTGIKPRLSR